MSVARQSRTMIECAGWQTASFAPFLWLKGQTRSPVAKVNGRRVQGENQPGDEDA